MVAWRQPEEGSPLPVAAWHRLEEGLRLLAAGYLELAVECLPLAVRC